MPTLNAKQMAAIPLLASGNKVIEVARQVGVDDRTISRWKLQTEFKEALSQAEDDIFNEAVSMLKRHAKDAVTTLIVLMGEDTKDYVRCQAASKVLDASLQVAKIGELEKLLEQLEGNLQ